MEWIIAGIVVIGVIAFAQMTGNAAAHAKDAWEVLPLAGRSKSIAAGTLPTTLEIASLAKGSRIVAFIAPFDAPAAVYAQANFDVDSGPNPDDTRMLVTARYHSLVWTSDAWTAASIAPPAPGSVFVIAADMIDHVYASGDTLHEKAA